jgi:hypothetical protein
VNTHRFAFNSAVLAALLAVSTSASAFSPPAPVGGPPDFFLDMPSSIDIGTFWHTCMTAPTGDVVVLLVGATPGPTATKFGSLDVGMPFLAIYPFVMPAPTLCFDHFVPCDPSLVGFTGYFQFVAFNPQVHSDFGVSNPVSLTVNPSFCCDPSAQIGANFNGTAIPAGATVWFNSIVKVAHMTGPTTVRFKHVTISLMANGTPYTLTLPNSRIEYSDTAAEATTDYDSVMDEWVTTVPTSYTGNVFLSGLGFNVPGGLPGGIKNVTWFANFESTTPGLSFQWKWASAVYTDFATDNNAIGVKPVDGNSVPSGFNNSDHAGTPEYWKSFVTGGAMGGGGSNFTGSYSGTQTSGCQ